MEAEASAARAASSLSAPLALAGAELGFSADCSSAALLAAASDSIVLAATLAIALLLADLDLAGPGFGVPPWLPLRPCECGSSVRSVETRIPRPLQCSHCTENAASSPDPTRFLVIWTRPSEVTSAT